MTSKTSDKSIDELIECITHNPNDTLLNLLTVSDMEIAYKGRYKIKRVIRGGENKILVQKNISRKSDYAQDWEYVSMNESGVFDALNKIKEWSEKE